MRSQSVSCQVAAVQWQAARCAWQLVVPGNAPGTAHRLGQQRRPFAYRGTVPAETVLVGEQNLFSLGVDPRGSAGSGEKQQREQGEDFGLAGHQLAEQPGQPQRLRLQVDPHDIPPAARGMGLGGDEVHHGEYSGQPLGQFGVGGHAVGDPRAGNLLPGPHQALGLHRVLGELQAAQGPDEGRQHTAALVPDCLGESLLGTQPRTALPFFIGTTGRSSTLPRQAAGIRAAHRIASSRSAASIR